MKYQFDEFVRGKTQLGFLAENQLPPSWEILLCTLVDLETASLVYRAESAGGNFGVPEEAWFADKAYTAADDVHIDARVVVPYVSLEAVVFVVLVVVAFAD